jgi:pimeloyl-ACP methyl ester carboxylesterase
MRPALFLLLALGATACGGDDETAAGAVDEGVCPPPPADVPLDLPIAVDGSFRSVAEFPLDGFEPRALVVSLPDGYDPARRYPVIYFTDGDWVFNAYSARDALEALVAEGLVEPHIIVAIDQVERTFELTPDFDPTFAEMGGGGDDFAAQLVGRVKPFVDASFSTRCGRESTTIAGFSLGGLLCLHMVLRDPDVFGRGVCMSPSLWWNAESILDRFDAHDGALPARLWLDVGTHEHNPPQCGADANCGWFHPKAIREGRDVALAKGMTLGGTLGYYEHFDAAHEFVAVEQRLPTVLAFALSDIQLADPAAAAARVWNDSITAPPADPSFESTISFELRYEDPFALTAPNAQVELASDDDAIATIDEDGLIHAVAPGAATFTAALDGLTASDSIDVAPAD